MTAKNALIRLAVDGAAQVQGEFGKVQSGLTKIEGAASSAQKMLATVGGALAALGLKGAFDSLIEEQEKMQRNMLRTEALLKSNGHAANLSSQQLRVNAQQLALATLQSVEGVEQAQQILLTFTNVTGSTFLRATELAADLATVTGGGLTGSMTMLGKALNDPIAGITAMTRAGVSFTEGQKDTIKGLVESNKLLDAQTIILDELARQYGGVAKAEATGYAGAIDTLGQRVQELRIGLADYLDIGNRVSVMVNALAGQVDGLTKSLKENAVAFSIGLGALAGAAAVAAVAGMSAALAGLGAALVIVKAKFIALTAVMLANPFGLLAIGIGAAAGALVAYNRSQAQTVPGMQRAITDLESANNGLLNVKGQAGMTAAERAGYDERVAKIKQLKAAVDTLKAPVVTGSVGSGDTALLRANRALRDAQALAVADFAAQNQTAAQKLNAELTKQRALMGDLFSPEIEAKIRAQFETKVKGASGAAAASKLETDALKALTQALETEAKFRQIIIDDELKQEKLLSDRMDSARQMLESIERETALLGLSNIEREQAIALFALERSGVIAGTEAYDAYAAKIREAISARGNKQTALDAVAAETAATAQAAKDATDAWQKTADSINSSLTDALMRGFESGKGFGKNLRDTLVNMFKTLILRPTISAILAPIAGGLSGAANAAAGGAIGGGGNITSIISSLNSSISTSIGDAFGQFARSSSGQSLGLSQSSAMGPLPGGGSLTSSGQLASQGLQVLGDTMAGFALGSMAKSLLSGGYSIGKGMETFQSAGIAVASAFFGPMWGAIAGAAAGAINRLFGRKLKDSGIEGTFGGDKGFAGNNFEFLKGGLLRSDKTKRNPLDEEVRKFLGDAFSAMRVQVGTFATALGLGTDKIAGFSSSIKLSLKGLSETDAKKKIDEALATANNELAQQVLGTFTSVSEQITRTVQNGNFSEGFDATFDEISETITKTAYTASVFARDGELAIDTLKRLSGSLIVVNGTFDTLGRTLLESSLAGGDTASKIADAFGGLEQLATATSTYYEAFYSDAQRAETTTRQLGETLGKLGLSLPASNAAFRELVELQDLNTESGRTNYAALLSLSGDFASVFGTAQQAADLASAAAADLASAAADALLPIAKMAEALANALGGLGDTKFDLESELLTAQGKTEAVRERIYARDLAALTKGLDAESALKVTAAFEVNEALRAQIKTQTEANAQRDIGLGLGRQILELNGDTVALRLLDIAGMSEGNVALYDRAKALGIEKTATESATAAALTLASTNRGIQDQIDILTGAETARSIALRDAGDDSTRALMKIVNGLQDVKTAAEEAATAATAAGATLRGLKDQNQQLRVADFEARGNTAASAAAQGFSPAEAAVYGDNAALKRSTENYLKVVNNQVAYEAAKDVGPRSTENYTTGQSNQASLESSNLAALASFQGGDAPFERPTVEGDLLTGLGSSAEALAKQAAMIEEATRSIADAAAQAATTLERFAGVMKTLLGEQADLQVDLLRAQGNVTGADTLARSNALDRLTEGMAAAEAAKITAQFDANQALRDQIKAATDATSAADRFTSAIRGIADSLLAEVDRIRGVLAESSLDGVAALGARFALATAQARAGDQTAAGNLTGLSGQLLGAAAGEATSRAGLLLMQAQVADSLQTTAGLLGGTVPTLAALPTQPTQNTERLEGLVVTLTDKIANLENRLADIQTNTRRTADVIDGGVVLTEAA